MVSPVSEPVIEIDTSTLAEPVGRTAHIRIGGTVYEARCPKDAVLFDIYTENVQDISVVRRFLAAILGTRDAAQVEEMLSSPDHPDVTYVTLYRVVNYLMSDPKGPNWGEAVAKSVQSLGSGKTPTTQKVARKAPVKATPRKAPAKRAAPRK